LKADGLRQRTRKTIRHVSATLSTILSTAELFTRYPRRYMALQSAALNIVHDVRLLLISSGDCDPDVYKLEVFEMLNKNWEEREDPGSLIKLT